MNLVRIYAWTLNEVERCEHQVSDHGAMAKDKIGGVSYVCQTWKKEYSDHSVLPFFIR